MYNVMNAVVGFCLVLSGLFLKVEDGCLSYSDWLYRNVIAVQGDALEYNRVGFTIVGFILVFIAFWLISMIRGMK